MSSSETQPLTDTQQARMALLFAVLSPVAALALLGMGASWAYGAVDGGAPRGLAGLLVWGALLLPCAQAVGVFWMTPSRWARIAGALLAAACVPANLMLLAWLSWTHD